MEADIGGEPAQHARQVVVGRALERRGGEIPLLLVGPVRLLVLVLDVEQPHPGGGADQGQRQVAEQERLPPQQHDHRHAERGEGRVGAEDARPRGALAQHGAGRNAVAHHEQPDRADAEGHQRVAVEPVPEAPRARQRQVLAHGERRHVADAALREVPRGRVVDGMAAPPEIVGRQREHADRAPEPVVDAPRRKEGAVAAVVLDHEQAHEQRAGRHAEHRRRPEAVVKPDEHRGGDGEEGERGGEDFQ